MRSDARRFREDSGVDIPGNPTRLPCQAVDLAQQMLAVSVSEALVGGWEVLADVTERRRAEDRVGDGVEQHIGVRMPCQPPIVRDLDAAEDQAPSRCKAMGVVADSDPRGEGKMTGRLLVLLSPLFPPSPPSLAEEGGGHGNILCMSHFDIRRGGGDHRHWQTGDLA